MIGLNARTGGSWGSHFVAHASQLHRVPAELPDEQAVLVDPIACSLHAVLRRPPLEGERIFIQGAGIVGVGVVLSLRALGYPNNIVGAARHEVQAARLRAAGANEVVIIPRDATREKQYTVLAPALQAERVAAAFGNQVLLGGADVVYDCVGTGRSLSDALKCCRAGGTVVALGTSQITFVDTTALWFKEVQVVGAFGRSFDTWSGGTAHTYEIVMQLAMQGRLSLAGLLTHTFAIADYRAAFAAHTARGKSGLFKAAFKP
jgi:threonine dehydrogenase-like Zn-dependent dehydrogenase